MNLVRAVSVGAMAVFMTACAGAPNNDTYSLSAASQVQARGSTARQILVPEPTALKALDSDQIVVRLSGSEIQYLANSQWSDRLPRIVQAKLVQSFENTGKVGGVGKPGEGLAIDFQVITEIRSFEIDTQNGDTALVEIFAKILNDRNGTVQAQKSFRSTVPVRGRDQQSRVAALDDAFADVASDIVTWTLKAI